MNSQLKEILGYAPPEANIRKDKNGKSYLPDEYIKNMLDANFDDWNVSYFKFDVESIGKIRCGLAVCTLQVKFGTQLVERKGACTVNLDEIRPEVDVSKYALINCIADAAATLGNLFGRSLNGGKRICIPFNDIFDIQKLIPSETIRAQRNQAIEQGRNDDARKLEDVYDFKTPHA